MGVIDGSVHKTSIVSNSVERFHLQFIHGECILKEKKDPGVTGMTLRQEAYGLIDALPDDCIRIIIRLMYKMESGKPATFDSQDEGKLNAFLELEQMRKSMVFPEDFDPEKELQEALDEKYGCID